MVVLNFLKLRGEWRRDDGKNVVRKLKTLPPSQFTNKLNKSNSNNRPVMKFQPITTTPVDILRWNQHNVNVVKDYSWRCIPSPTIIIFSSYNISISFSPSSLAGSVFLSIPIITMKLFSSINLPNLLMKLNLRLVKNIIEMEQRNFTRRKFHGFVPFEQWIVPKHHLCFWRFKSYRIE